MCLGLSPQKEIHTVWNEGCMEIPESCGREIKRGLIGMGANTGHAMDVLLLWAVGVTPEGDYGRQCRMLSKVTLLKKQDGVGIHLPAWFFSL